MRCCSAMVKRVLSRTSASGDFRTCTYCRCGYMNVVAYISLWPLVSSSPYQSEE